MRVAAVNGVRIHYADQGDPGGLPMVFANSLGTDLRVWDRLLPMLPPGLRLIRADMRGHGLSDAPAGPYAMDDLVADAAGLMDHLGLKGSVFVGLSIGGVVAQGLAAARPDLLRGLILTNTAARIGVPEMWDHRIATIRAGGIAAMEQPILERWFSKPFREGRPDEFALWRHMLTRTPLDGYIACCEAIKAADLRGSTARLRLPTLVVAGSEDGSTPPELVRETAASIAGSRFEIIAGAGHIPCVEAPRALAPLIGDFLRANGLI